MPPIFPQNTGDKRADVIRVTQRMFDAMEDVIRQYPDQWEMFRQFWPDDDPSALAADETPEQLTATAASSAFDEPEERANG